MSARDTLRTEMTSHHLYMTGEWADELIDACAHELAEQIRAEQNRQEAEERERFGRLDHEATLQREAARAAAALIDPEAQS